LNRWPALRELRGYRSFIDAHHVQVEETTGTAQEKTSEAI
jgi:hypothetical protein